MAKSITIGKNAKCDPAGISEEIKVVAISSEKLKAKGKFIIKDTGNIENEGFSYADLDKGVSIPVYNGGKESLTVEEQVK